MSHRSKPYEKEVREIYDARTKSLWPKKPFWTQVRPAHINNTFVLTFMDVYVVWDTVFNNVSELSETIEFKSLTTGNIVVIPIEIIRKQEESNQLVEIFHTDYQYINEKIQNYLLSVTK